jgi:hypothetical protein
MRRRHETEFKPRALLTIDFGSVDMPPLKTRGTG